MSDSSSPRAVSADRAKTLALVKALRPARSAPVANRAPGGLYAAELSWRNYYSWLKESGYLLRPRYNPEWVPTWQGTRRNYESCEDGQTLLNAHLSDATRISDGSLVILKKVLKSYHPEEANIGRYFSVEPLSSNPHNHCVPILDVLQVPDDEDETIVVMPLLRKYDDPPFDTVGEVIDYFSQAFQGLALMHEHNIAHRDCNGNNTMMDPTAMYPDLYHPVKTNRARNFRGNAQHYTRTERPPKYYFVDYGLSRRYKLEDRPPMEDIIVGGDKTAPEHRNPVGQCDPFPTDVYYLGNMIREDFLKKKVGFEFMTPLVADMVHEDPAKRPQMPEVVARFVQIRASLGPWKLRSRVVGRKDSTVVGVFRSIAHWRRRVGYVLNKVPPIPSTAPAPAPAVPLTTSTPDGFRLTSAATSITAAVPSATPVTAPTSTAAAPLPDDAPPNAGAPPSAEVPFPDVKSLAAPSSSP